MLGGLLKWVKIGRGPLKAAYGPLEGPWAESGYTNMEKMVWSAVDVSLRDVVVDLWTEHEGLISYGIQKGTGNLHLGLWVPKKGGAINLRSYAQVGACLEMIADRIMEKGMPSEYEIVSWLQCVRKTLSA